MLESAIREKAIAYEALVQFYKGDENKAWETLISLNADFSSSFASYTREFVASVEEENLFNQIWRSVRDAFSNEKVPFSILSENDATLLNRCAPIHFLYSAGRELNNEKRLVFLGSPLPSLQAKSDAFKAVEFAASKGWTIVAPLDSGIPSYALYAALKMGANTVAVLPSGISKCPSEGLLEIMGKVYEKGTLITQFSPAVKYEKWHVVLRNRFLASFGDGYILAEEKDGGPSWSVFDGAIEKGKSTSIPKSLINNSNFSWCGKRLKENKTIAFEKGKDLLKLFPPSKKINKKERFEDSTQLLFDL